MGADTDGKTGVKLTWVIGASSGIGEAVARQLAIRGEKLILSGRDLRSLEWVREDLAGDGHHCLPVDVADARSVATCGQALARTFPKLDRVLFFAATYSPASFGQMDLDEVSSIVDTNLKGAFYVVETALPLMSPGGQIALCGSVAGYRGLPRSQPYAATKAGIISLATSLRAEWGGWLDIKLINPGFVKTKLTDKNNFHMPFIITAEAAAKIIVPALDKKRFEIHFPLVFTSLLKLMSALPHGLYFRLVGRKDHRENRAL